MRAWTCEPNCVRTSVRALATTTPPHLTPTHPVRSKLDALIFMAAPVNPNYMFWLTGSNNKVNIGTVSSAGSEYTLPSSPSLDSFNWGRPIIDQVGGEVWVCWGADRAWRG